MASRNANIAFVLVPGSFCQPWMFEKVISVLTAAPYSLPESSFHSITLLTTVSDRPEGPASMFDDAALVASTIKFLSDQGKDVVLVMSSYGGFPGSEAAYGLSKASRIKQGLKGGIKSLVYLAAFMPKIGQCVKELSGGIDAGEADYMSLDYPIEFATAILPDLTDPEEQKKYFLRMTKHSRRSFDDRLEHEGWREVKSVYVWPKGDAIIKPEVQQELFDYAKGQGAEVEVLEREGWGHVPQLGKERQVAEILYKAAGL